MSLLDIVQQHLGPDEIQAIRQHLGTDPATTSNAIEAALPMIVGGMAHTVQQRRQGSTERRCRRCSRYSRRKM